MATAARAAATPFSSRALEASPGSKDPCLSRRSFDPCLSGRSPRDMGCRATSGLPRALCESNHEQGGTHKDLNRRQGGTPSLYWRPSLPPSASISRLPWVQDRRGFAEASRKRAGRLQVRSSNEDKGSSNGAGVSTTGKKDVAGAGVTWASPEWLTSLVQLLRGRDTSGIPVADAKLEDVQDLLGGALFLPLFKWMLESGPVYRLAAGPRNFVIIGEPEAAKHVLRGYGSTYAKGLVAEVAEFLFGSGFAIAEGDLWTVRRRAVVPALHRAYLSLMVETVFASCTEQLCRKLEGAAQSGAAVNMEAQFSQLTLDVIGQSVFNFEFDALRTDSPLIQAVYTSLKETESRSTDILPYWQVPLLCLIDPRQQKAAAAVRLIRETVEELVARCKEMVEREGEQVEGDEYVNQADPSILRFLLASREEVSSQQLRDDLLSMLVAGHETTGSVLTWTVYLLALNPDKLKAAQEEVDRVLAGKARPSFADTRELKYVTRCINESMRIYPHPPVLIRRALKEDTLPGGYQVGPGQDVMISVYNIHHSPQVWDNAEDFIPERFNLDAPVPNEVNTDFRYIPFSGGPRKCVGDQFAMLEAIVALSILLKQFEFQLVPNHEIGMTTGATIHTKNGLYMYVTQRDGKQVQLGEEAALAGTS